MTTRCGADASPRSSPAAPIHHRRRWTGAHRPRRRCSTARTTMRGRCRSTRTMRTRIRITIRITIRIIIIVRTRAIVAEAACARAAVLARRLSRRQCRHRLVMADTTCLGAGCSTCAPRPGSSGMRIGRMRNVNANSISSNNSSSNCGRTRRWRATLRGMCRRRRLRRRRRRLTSVGRAWCGGRTARARGM